MRGLFAYIGLILVLAGCLSSQPDLPGGSVDPTPESQEWEWPPLEEAWLRPGDKLFPEDLSVDDGVTVQTCTVNFVFLSEDNTSLFVGTAAHCLTAYSVGDPLLVSGKVKAEVAYCSWGTIDETDRCTDKATGGLLTNPDEEGFANDFALLQVAPEHERHVHPALRHWGGPMGISSNVQVGDRAMTYGNSMVRDAGTDSDVHDAREGYVRQTEEWSTTVLFLTGPLPGDSGSPVIHEDGSALGIVQTHGAEGAGLVDLEKALDFHNDHKEVPVRLAQWELLTPASIPDPLETMGVVHPPAVH